MYERRRREILALRPTGRVLEPARPLRVSADGTPTRWPRGRPSTVIERSDLDAAAARTRRAPAPRDRPRRRHFGHDRHQGLLASVTPPTLTVLPAGRASGSPWALTLVSEARGRPADIASRREQIDLAAGRDDQFRDVLATAAAAELAMTQLDAMTGHAAGHTLKPGPPGSHRQSQPGPPVQGCRQQPGRQHRYRVQPPDHGPPRPDAIEITFGIVP